MKQSRSTKSSKKKNKDCLKLFSAENKKIIRNLSTGLAVLAIELSPYFEIGCKAKD